jgi:GNAT superfamily N-acetyltransferase
MTFADLDLSRRLERAEGRSCLEFAEARGRLFPESGATWIECAGAYAVFDGVNSPVTQSFGLGVFEPLSSAALDRIETFFLDRQAAVLHEVSPLAGVPALDLLCSRGYRPIELSSVLYRPVEPPAAKTHSNGITVRVAGADDAAIWVEMNARGWGEGHPELMDFLGDFGPVAFAREHTVNFLAEVDGQAGGAGALSLHDGVALFAGAATIPEMRRRGLQGALLEARMRYAYEHKCELAMMVTEAGSQSQRNAERKGFRIAYTRTKWQLNRP